MFTNIIIDKIFLTFNKCQLKVINLKSIFKYRHLQKELTNSGLKFFRSIPTQLCKQHWLASLAESNCNHRVWWPGCWRFLAADCLITLYSINTTEYFRYWKEFLGWIDIVSLFQGDAWKTTDSTSWYMQQITSQGAG